MPAKIEKGTGTHRVKRVRAYAALTNAVALEANTSYFLVSQEVNGGDHGYDDNTGVATTNGATITAAVYAANNSTAYSLGTGTTTNSTFPVGEGLRQHKRCGFRFHKGSKRPITWWYVEQY